MSEEHTLDLETVQLLVNQIVGHKAAFFDFVGMPEAGGHVARYVEAANAAEQHRGVPRTHQRRDQLRQQGAHVVDAVFPWGVTNGFKRVSA